MNPRPIDDSPVLTEMSVQTTGPHPTIAPNGSSEGQEWVTVRTLRQDWPHAATLGIYAGKSYLITETYIATQQPRGSWLGDRQALSSSPLDD